MIPSVFKSAALAVLTLGALVVEAVPTAVTAGIQARSEGDFVSLEKWITDKINNPNGKHFSPEEAFAA